jgi:hypothetical protein
MKTRLAAVLFTAFIASAFVSAQDLQEILDTYFETIGQENIVKKKSQVVTGKSLQMGQEMPFKFVTKRPDKAYIEVDLGGTLMKQGYDGTNGWAVMPWTGSAEPVDLTGPDLKGLKEMADMDGALWDYENKGHQLELTGTEDMDGTEVFVLKLTKEDGDIQYYYMDSENYVVLKVVSKTIVNGSEVEVEALMSNFQDINGYIIPLTTEQRFNGQPGMTINIEEVKMDEEIDDGLFMKPSSPVEKKEE